MNEVSKELAKQGPIGVVLAVLLWIHAQHVGRLVQAVESIGPQIKSAVKEAMRDGKN